MSFDPPSTKARRGCFIGSTLGIEFTIFNENSGDRRHGKKMFKVAKERGLRTNNFEGDQNKHEILMCV